MWVQIVQALIQSSLQFSLNCSKFVESVQQKVYLTYVCTGCAIKIGTHYFNLSGSHDVNSSNFIATFIYFFTELSFEVYNSFLGPLA